MSNIKHDFLKYIIIINILLNARISTAICIDQICDSLQDVPLENVSLQWVYVHFDSWFPIKLQYLPSNFFTNHGQLEYITFKRMLRGIDKNALNNLNNLQTIVFHNNALEHIPKEVFQNCPKLEKIWIKNCGLNGIEPGTFDNLDNLQHLKIEGNNLGQIVRFIIPKILVELILSENKITYIEEDVFYDMDQLQILDLSENYLTTFEFRKYLIQTPRLRELQIGDNYLDNLSTLPRLAHLKYFYIENNSISTMELNTFENTAQLEVINLSENNLRAISSNNFSTYPLRQMKKLYLSYNNLKCIDLELLELFPNLKTLWFGMNNLECQCYKNVEEYLVKRGIITLYNFDKEYEKYSVCKNNGSIQLLK